MKFTLNKNLFFIEGKGFILTSNEGSNRGDWTAFPNFTNDDITGIDSNAIKKAEYDYAANGIYNLKIIATDNTFKLEGIPQFELPNKDIIAVEIEEEDVYDTIYSEIIFDYHVGTKLKIKDDMLVVKNYHY